MSGMALAEIARRAGIALTTLHAFVSKPGAEMRASNYEKVAAALASLNEASSPAARRGVREDPAAFAAGKNIAISVAIPAEIAANLQKSGIDIEEVARKGAEKALMEANAHLWREANAEAIEASNRWIEKHGTLAEQLGLI